MKANIDGDIIIYEAGFSAEVSYYEVAEEECFSTKKEAKEFCEFWNLELEAVVKKTKPLSLAQTLARVNQVITDIINGARCTEYEVFLTGANNYRIKAAEALPEPYNVYKGNRDTSHKPVHFDKIKEHLINVWRATTDPDLEADDMLGMVQDKDTVLCSIDKDLDMIQGWHYNWRKQERYFVGPKAAKDFFYEQLITGDRTDNIPGLYALTGKKATKKIKEELKALPEEQKLDFIQELYGEQAKHFDTIRNLITIALGPCTFVADYCDCGNCAGGCDVSDT
jgi:hypothetical protein